MDPHGRVVQVILKWTVLWPTNWVFCHLEVYYIVDRLLSDDSILSIFKKPSRYMLQFVSFLFTKKAVSNSDQYIPQKISKRILILTQQKLHVVLMSVCLSSWNYYIQKALCLFRVQHLDVTFLTQMSNLFLIIRTGNIQGFLLSRWNSSALTLQNNVNK